MSQLDDFNSGKPLNDRLKRLMEGAEDESSSEQAQEPKAAHNYEPLTNNERKHLERLVNSAGWQVLLKLLDIGLRHQEDDARRNSLQSPLTRKDEIAAKWAQLAADQAARNKIEAVVANEIEIMKATAKKK